MSKVGYMCLSRPKASLMAQMVKSMPAKQGTWFQSLIGKLP